MLFRSEIKNPKKYAGQRVVIGSVTDGYNPQEEQFGIDFDTERGQLCPMAMHVAFPYIDILRYGGHLPGQEDGTAVFCCPDVDTINVFRIEIVE